MSISQDLTAILQRVADNENLHHCEITQNSSSEIGDGYMGLINFCQIKGTTPGGKPKVLDLVVKSAHTNEKLRENLPVKGGYYTESYHYKVIHPKFRQIQKEYHVPDPFDSMLKCYFIEEKEGQEVIVMQNLSANGYRMWNRRLHMNEEHVIFVLQHYGKLHAMSYALRQVDEEAFLKISSSLVYHNLKDFVVTSENALMGLIDKVVASFDQEKDVILIKRVSKFKSSLVTFFLEEFEKRDQYSVISHGDCWTNNMMFRYEDESEPLTPSSMYFIDWQCSTLGSPALDLAYFFICCSPKDIMDKAEKYIRVYYESLSAHLRKFGGDPEVALPYEELLDQWKRYSRYGLALAFIIVKIQIGEPDDLPNVTASSEAGKNAADSFFDLGTDYNEVYYKRIKDIVSYFIENDLL